MVCVCKSTSFVLIIQGKRAEKQLEEEKKHGRRKK
jgi:hypothetical protein